MKQFFTLAEAAAYLTGQSDHPLTERDVINMASDTLPVSFHYRGNIGLCSRAQPIKFRCYFDGYLRSRSKIRLGTVVDGFRTVQIDGKTATRGFSKVFDAMTPSSVEIIKTLHADQTPPEISGDEFFVMLTESGDKSYSNIPVDQWLFHIGDLDKVSREDGTIHPPAAVVSGRKRGVTKAEIIAAEWPMPSNAPTLENILNKIPSWVDEACIKVGRAGKGQSGSHLWNPVMLAVCLAVLTPHKKWTCNQLALTNFLRAKFPDYFDESDEKQKML